MGSQFSDNELVELVLKGNKHAFDLIVEKYQFRLHKLVSRYISDQSEALDVTQESFLKAYKALSHFRGDSSFYTWLYRIAINSSKNYLASQYNRSMKSTVELMDIDQLLLKNENKEFTSPDKIIQSNEIEHVLYNAIDHLPKELKAAITLHEVEGLSYEEIADVMSCPIGTVRSRIYRARAAIERKVKPILRNT
jgi:RNA polymerase sigma-70 factor (ECF subfamily)